MKASLSPRRSPSLPRPVRAAALAAALLAVLSLASPLSSPAQPDPEADGPIVGSIVITGNQKTDAEVIRRELGFREGDPFPEDRIDDIWDNLEDTGYFAFVDIAWEETAPDTLAVVVTVEEESTAHVRPYLAYSRRHKYLVGASAADLNFRGRGERLEVTGVWERLHGYEGSWRRPWFLGRADLTAGLSAGWETADFVFRPTDYQEWAVRGTLRWDLRRPLFLEGGLGYGGFEVMDRFQQPAVDRGEGGFGLVDQAPRWRERLTLALTAGLDSRDMRYYPTRGAFHRLIGRRVEGRGFASFDELVADLRQFLPTPWKHVLALRAFGRLVDHPLQLEDRFFWGGPENLRGYDYAVFEGEEAYLLTAEYRWPLFLMPISPRGHVIGVGVHFFTDVGDVWFEGAEPGRARKDWGAGAHLNVSTLQLRFEVAWTETGEPRFQFLDTFNF